MLNKITIKKSLKYINLREFKNKINYWRVQKIYQINTKIKNKECNIEKEIYLLYYANINKKDEITFKFQFYID